MGVVFTFLLDLILTKLKNHPLMKKIIENWGWKERVVCVLIWPIAILIFGGSLIISSFRK
jgi:hypothetical protein